MSINYRGKITGSQWIYFLTLSQLHSVLSVTTREKVEAARNLPFLFDCARIEICLWFCEDRFVPYIKSGRVSSVLKIFSTAWIYFDCLDIIKDLKKMPVYTIKDLVEATQIQVIVKSSC